MAKFEDVLKKLGKEAPRVADRAIGIVADELLRLSVKEVPHDEGFLQASGSVQKMGEGTRQVGYHTKYAARLHEHPEFRFQKGRKGKYLEDPLKNNLKTFQKFYADELQKGLQQ